MSKYILTRTEVNYIVKSLEAAHTLALSELDITNDDDIMYYGGYKEAIQLAISMLKNIDKNSNIVSTYK